jgi:hypothetical protein
LQIAALLVENTFTSVEDMVSRVLPPLGAVIGTGKPLNFLVSDKWHNERIVATLPKGLPILLMASVQVTCAE